MTTDVLDLDAAAPPEPPRRPRSRHFGVRLPSHLARWVDQRTYLDHCTPSQYLTRLVERDMNADHLPSDVTDWLVTQAAQIGMPGEPDRALVAVIRHLAERWPEGARLR